MSTALLTIEQIKSMPAMVIPGVQGTLVEVKEYKPIPNGAKGPTTVQSFKIQEGNNWIFGDAWGMQDLSPWRGHHVIFVSNKTGNNKLAGVQIKEKPSADGSKTYKNISLSSTATMHDKDTYEASRGSSPTPSMQPPPALNAPFVPKTPPANVTTPNPGFTAQGAPTPLMRYSEAFPSQATAINGATVGMALKLAGDFIIAGSAPGSEVDRPEVIEERLHALASMIIRTSERLERGELAQSIDSVVTRVANMPSAGSVSVEALENAIPKPRAKPTPGPGNSAFPAHGNDDDSDNVPF